LVTGSIVGSASGFRYIPALDGMRACAVLAVLLYHADVAFLPGGFLGVELFFAVSGYLITALLLSERKEHGETDLLAFWLRRARRLFPALWTLLLLVPVYAAVAVPEELYRLRDDVLGALLYVTNWQLIQAQHSYFAQIGRPSLLQHLWSLAVEEQFYLVWPLLFASVLGKLKPQRAALALLFAALVSLGFMAHLYDPGLDPSRVYYGSDTRAFGLLIGAALAFALEGRSWTLSARTGARLAGLGAGALALCFTCLSELDARVYPGGFLLVDVATCLLIVGNQSAPDSFVLRWLKSRSLVEVGKRSYSLYLWHWPVFMLTRPELDGSLSGASSFFWRFLLTALLAEASYRWIERPLRERGALTRFARHGLRVGLAATALVMTFGFSTRALISAQEPLRADLTLSLPAQEAALTTAAGSPTVSALAGSARTQLTAEPPRVLAIGDSVMLGARKFLGSSQAAVEVDAAVGRTPLLTLSLLKKRSGSLKDLDVVIIHLGNNGPFQAEQFDGMVELLRDVPHVVFVTAKVPRRLGIYNNRTIREGVERHPHTALLDWFEAAKDHGEWFREDGLHLRESGATVYARLLAEHYLSR
jgi:peptidoglycan/LPS O-acetylase OafA/YrhL